MAGEDELGIARAQAVPELFLWVNDEGGFVVVVEGTQADELLAFLLERDAARADEGGEVVAALHPLDLGFIYQHPAFFTFRRFSKNLSSGKCDY